MLKFVQHIQYVANSRDEFVTYMEKNFGLKPDEVEDREAGSKHALYRVGNTEIQVSEPAPGSGQAEYLAKHGPGVHHVAWAIDDATQAVQQLKANGNTLRGEQGSTQSAHGYTAINIDPKDSMGIHFQLVDDRR